MIYLDWVSTSDFSFQHNEVRIPSTNNNFLFESTGTLITGTMTFGSNCISNKERLCESSNSELLNKLEEGFPTICETIPAPSNEPIEPSNEPIEPSNEPIEPSNEPIEPSNEPIEPSNEPIEPSNEPIEPSNEPIEPSNEPIEPIEPSNEPIEPTLVISPTILGPLDDELTVDDSINFKGDSIELTKDGFKVGDNEEFLSEKKSDIIIINTQEDVSLIKINTTHEKPEKTVIISPSNKNTDAIILAPSDGSNDYGQGEIGINANSNLNNIILQTEKVPLNIYNNETTDISIKMDHQIKESTFHLNNLIINNGSLQMKVPDEIQNIQFNIVEVYKIDKIETKNNNAQVETKIDELRLKKGSQLTLVKTNIAKVIKASPRSKLVIEGSAAFNNETKIEMTETSFINFGSSEVNGVCNEIKLNEDKEDVGILLDDEKSIPLICGSNFDCSAWKEKYVGNAEFFAAKCISRDNQICLAATNKANIDAKNNGLPIGATIAIVVVVIVVVIAVIVIVIVVVKRRNTQNYNHFNDEFANEMSDRAGMDESMDDNSFSKSDNAEFDNIMYNSADNNNDITLDPFLKEFDD